MCSTTPRFSYRPPETVICACSRGPVLARRTGMCTSSGVWWVPGWVYRVGNGRGIPGGYTGYYPAARCRHARTLLTAERAPEAPVGGWSGWSGGSVPGTVSRVPYMTSQGRPVTTPAGPGRSPLLGALPVTSPSKRRDYGHNLRKLVKTAKCHQNSQKRPVIVPVSQTASESHLLKF